MNLPTRAQRPSGSITRLVWLFVLALFLVPAFAQPASALRICTYNLLNYDNQLAVRDPAFRTVMSNLSGVDVLAVQEVQDQTAMNNFLNNVLNVVEPGQWAIATFFNDPSQSFNQGMFYRISAVDVVLADTLGNSPRDIAYYTVRPDGYASSAAEVTLFTHHFKAGSSGSDQSTRQAEADRIRLFLNTNFSSTDNFILLGDFNMRSSTEGAYQELTQSQANNDGRLFDPINTPGSWYNNFNFRFIHTQSTRTGFLSPGDGGATGGMDDRFDIILTSSALNDGDGLDQIESTYEAYGQDGSHFNSAISDAPTIPEGQVVADALERASDHLPVFMDFQVPAIASADASLNFGTVIVGATANQTLNVTNTAVTPADDLDYDLTPTAGFTAPGGTFMEPAGGGNNMHTIGMDTGTAGNKNGDVTLASNDVDNPSIMTTLSGLVLDHAVPSLDGSSQVLAELVDWGSQEEGNFTNQSTTVENLNYGALQALLNVYDAQITGGGGRFSIQGGFTASDIGGTGETYTLVFDDLGATVAMDSTYTATLVFSTRDQQGLPGATNLSDLTVNLSATVLAATSSSGDIRPTLTKLHPAAPNPFARSAQIRFDLAQSGSVDLSIYDVQGRLIRDMVHSWMPAGSYSVTWDGKNQTGLDTAPGVYFYILQTPNYRDTRRVIKVQ